MRREVWHSPLRHNTVELNAIKAVEMIGLHGNIYAAAVTVLKAPGNRNLVGGEQWLSSTKGWWEKVLQVKKLLQMLMTQLHTVIIQNCRLVQLSHHTLQHATSSEKRKSGCKGTDFTQKTGRCCLNALIFLSTVKWYIETKLIVTVIKQTDATIITWRLWSY